MSLSSVKETINNKAKNTMNEMAEIVKSFDQKCYFGYWGSDQAEQRNLETLFPKQIDG